MSNWVGIAHLNETLSVQSSSRSRNKKKKKQEEEEEMDSLCIGEPVSIRSIQFANKKYFIRIWSEKINEIRKQNSV